MSTKGIAIRILTIGFAIVTAVTATGCGILQKETPPARREWDAISSEGVMRVGTEGTYSPYSYHGDDGNLTGYDIELVEAIAKQMGLKVEFEEMGFDGLAAGLDAEQFDMVADQICITEERQQKYMFSTPYAYVKGVVITRADTDDISSFEDLDGKKVSLTVTSNWAKLAESHGAEIVSTSGFAESMQMVIDGRADATVNDNLVFLDYMSEHPAAGVKVAATAEETDIVALMLRGNQGEFRDKVNNAIAELDSEGFLTKLSKRYFGEDIAHEGQATDSEADEPATESNKS